MPEMKRAIIGRTMRKCSHRLVLAPLTPKRISFTFVKERLRRRSSPSYGRSPRTAPHDRATGIRKRPMMVRVWPQAVTFAPRAPATCQQHPSAPLFSATSLRRPRLKWHELSAACCVRMRGVHVPTPSCSGIVHVSWPCSKAADSSTCPL